MRWFPLVAMLAYLVVPGRNVPAVAAPAPAPAPKREPPPPPPPPPPPACEQDAARACHAAATIVDSGSSLTVKLSESVTQGIANGRTFDEPYWDCDVYVIGAGRVVRQTHHDADLVFKLPHGRYVVRLDSCFGCRDDVAVTVDASHSAIVNGTCHTQGK